MSRFTAYTAIALSLAAAAGCGPARTAAATQSTIKAFDASKSDPKAVAVADAVLTALGGEAGWAKAKEISFTQLVIVDGKLLDVSKHIWDRWNGRHHYEHMEPKGQWDVTMYEMFGGMSYAYFYNARAKENKVANAMKDEKAKLVEEAKKRFDRDVYRVMLPYKLKDPGVKLTYAEELPEEGSPKGSPMKYDEIKITFDAGVGPTPGDTWYLMVNKETHLPAVIEHVLTGKPDTEREGIKLDDWQPSGDLKFAGMQTTLGYTKPDAPKQPVEVPEDWKKDEDVMGGVAGVQAPKPGEIVLIKDVKVEATPNEDNFIPAVD